MNFRRVHLQQSLLIQEEFSRNQIFYKPIIHILWLVIVFIIYDSVNTEFYKSLHLLVLTMMILGSHR